ncbi:MAG: MarR family winged helix-turn-helix transcriptional regulator [Solirubrobacterales bacterium]
MSEDPRILPIHIPLTALLDLVFEAMRNEFRGAIEASEFDDLRITHGSVFRYVRETGMRLTEIAERANVTKQSAGEIVDELVDRGYVERAPDPLDGRAKLVCLTTRGERAQEFGFRAFAAIERHWAERFGAERIAELRRTLEAIVAAEAPHAVPEAEIAGAGDRG